MCLLSYQFHYLFKKAAGKFPFWIQLSWTLTNIFYVTTWYRPNQQLEIPTNLFDALTKVLIIYFICIRLIVTADIQTKIIKQISFFLFMTGIFLSILVNVPQALQPYYQIGDFYISIIEILSMYLYIYTKFKCTSIKQVLVVIRQLQLTTTTLIVFFSAILSALTAILEQTVTGIDYDYMFNASLTAIKYAMLAFVIFQKTLGANGKIVSYSQPKPAMASATLHNSGSNSLI